ncbi:MAG TPA: UDP-N-acetylmuramoyl-tripeptide--D-alanyl-D-alanine ligase [Sphingobacteriaceae bacterium]
MVTVEKLYDLFKQHPVICTDTRKITSGCLFFALKGENFDANQFAESAIGAGAAYAIIDNESYQKDDRFLLVEDVLKALQDLATFHRSQLNIPFIGITGTNGKTTTKELVNSVLSQHYRTYATQGNLNNHIGVPLTVLSITPDIEVAIIEMGANHQKEISFLCQIAQPGYGLITNVGKAHLEGFGGFEGVKIAKGELYQYLSNTNGTVFINHDNSHLLEMSAEHGVKKAVYYGTGEDNFLTGQLINQSPLQLRWNKGQETQSEVTAHLTGTYNFENILAAITLGSFFNLSVDEINAGISSYVPTNNRSQIKKTLSNTVICDYYNANPSSMAMALENLIGTSAENKGFILGDMFELGQESESEHRQVLEKASNLKSARKIYVGKEFYAVKNDDGEFYETVTQAQEAIKAKPFGNATILVKGSRGMKLETLMDLL